MKFYAYVPDKNGQEPMGTDKKLLFELKTLYGAIRRATRILGSEVRVFRYINFYDDMTFARIK